MTGYLLIFKWPYMLLIFHVLTNSECNGLSADVVAPSSLAVGTSADLVCKWGVNQNEQIYSVKWYQGLNEIYRYTPSKFPKAVQLFKNDFLLIDPTASDRGKIRVTNVTLGANGIFRCEVSAEAPSFYTVYGTVNITVVSPPDGNPYLSGKLPQYEVGEWVDLRCTTSKSKPAPALRFYVNEQEPRADWLEPQVSYPTIEGLEKTSLRLRFALREAMLDFEGKMQIRCAAEILDVYYGSTNFLVKTGRLQSASAYGAKAAIQHETGQCLPIICLLGTLVYASLPLAIYV